jgi:hypothetical protein
LVDTMPRYGSKPLRPCFCLAQSDAGDGLSRQAPTEVRSSVVVSSLATDPTCSGWSRPSRGSRGCASSTWAHRSMGRIAGIAVLVGAYPRRPSLNEPNAPNAPFLGSNWVRFAKSGAFVLLMSHLYLLHPKMGSSQSCGNLSPRLRSYTLEEQLFLTSCLSRPDRVLA